MKKAVLISIRAGWCSPIRAGIKRWEIRKNKPKIPTPFKCYIYMSKGKERLIQIIRKGDNLYGDEVWKDEKPLFIKTGPEGQWEPGCQKVIGEFICDEIVPIYVHSCSAEEREAQRKIINGACLTDKQLKGYMGEAIKGYAWHISNLVIYETPKPLSDFYKYCEYFDKQQCFAPSVHFCSRIGVEVSRGPRGEITTNRNVCLNELKRPPQSWCYVEKL